jgi:hypothetical protein
MAIIPVAILCFLLTISQLAFPRAETLSNIENDPAIEWKHSISHEKIVISGRDYWSNYDLEENSIGEKIIKGGRTPAGNDNLTYKYNDLSLKFTASRINELTNAYLPVYTVSFGIALQHLKRDYGKELTDSEKERIMKSIRSALFAFPPRNSEEPPLEDVIFSFTEIHFGAPK